MHHTQGGLGFESLILHHTVRTRTRFFMKKGSGTFLFIGGLRLRQQQTPQWDV